MQHISEVLSNMYPNIDRLSTVNWTSLTLKQPVVFRMNDTQYIIRNMKNYKGNILCELQMDDDKFIRNLNTLPEEVRQTIDQRLKIQAA